MTSARTGTSEARLLVSVALGNLLVPLNSTMIAVALPRMLRGLDAGVGDGGWIVTGYLIAMASVQPVAGKLGDRLGRRRLLLGGLVLFGVSSVAAAAAPTLATLVAARLGQAITGAVFFPNAAALMREVVPSERRASVFGLMGSSLAFAAAVGPPLGGLVTELAGWRAIFLVNVPIVAAAFVLGSRVYPRRIAAERTSSFDARGAVLIGLVLASGAWLLNRSGGQDTTAVAVEIALAAGFALFLRGELRHADPVVQPRLFRRRTFAAASAMIGLSNLSMYSTLFAVPLVLEARRWSPGSVGLVLTAFSAAMAAMSPIGGRLADRFGRRAPAVAGLVLLGAGLVPLALSGARLGSAALVAALLAAGAGMGSSTAAIQTAAVESVDVRDAGMAAGISSTSRYVGSIVGTSILAGLLRGEGGVTEGAGMLFTVTAATAWAAAAIGIGLPGPRRRIRRDVPLPAAPAP